MPNTFSNLKTRKKAINTELDEANPSGQMVILDKLVKVYNTTDNYRINPYGFQTKTISEAEFLQRFADNPRTETVIVDGKQKVVTMYGDKADCWWVERV